MPISQPRSTIRCRRGAVSSLIELPNTKKVALPPYCSIRSRIWSVPVSRGPSSKVRATMSRSGSGVGAGVGIGVGVGSGVGVRVEVGVGVGTGVGVAVGVGVGVAVGVGVGGGVSTMVGATVGASPATGPVPAKPPRQATSKPQKSSQTMMDLRYLMERLLCRILGYCITINP